MESKNNNSQNKNPDKIVRINPAIGRYIYSTFHSIMSLVAFYLSFKCNKGFAFGPFLVACCCPYFYIIYILATRGTCSNEKLNI